MNILSDKDAGELWVRRLAELEAAWPDRRGAEAFEMDIVIGLICKLVETEAHVIWLKSDKGLTKAFFADAYFQQCREEACHKFNIDPATYPRASEG